MALRRHVAIAAALGIASTALWTPTAIAEEAVLPGAGAQAVEGSYIVVLKDGARTPAGALASRYQGSVKHTYSAALNGFSVTGMSERQARRLAADPDVQFVERNTFATIQGTQSNPVWGLDRIDQANLPLNRSYTYPNTASNVTAYVLDTGIRKTHSEFEGRASDGYDFIDNDAVAQDCQGHGSHVAGTVAGRTYGVAKKAKVVGVRVLDCNGSGAWDGIIRGIDWVTANGKKPAVVNMSLGGSGTNTSLENAVRRSISAGFTYVLAGGNSGQDACNFTPARTPEAITVGASDRADKRSIWTAGSSNYGRCLDIWAPGSDIVSASHSSDTGTRSMGGTSMASPHVAGAAALYLSAHPAATPAQVRNALVGAATPNKLTDIRTGSPNLLLKV
ncbi:Serine protease, subtilisin family [Lentzea albidocapillata subsp. violacea]|uniref:Serine protease, subtilisin family n=1 Tax=Lentzea albidocapillata subsp. violacea TaxID=128104 RepID=A0A1G8X1W8_9PSEU|nr:S8 family peptidase [Lentzea albidocapillata]SDJ84326.1 Serine protease, subtilisin family [Lentzea albidocapillata subsp. violacea]